MRILLIGKDGQLGWELRRTLAPLSEIVALGHRELDLADSSAIRAAVRLAQPHLIVNAAAYTAVDQAEEERNLAFEINAIAPQVLAEEAKRLGAGLVHYSTDYVFDGSATLPYTEDHVGAPLGIYGASKLAGDTAVMQSGSASFIFRTSWVYSSRGRNFFLTVLRLARGEGRLSIVQDQIGAPTWSRMIAQATSQVVTQCFSPLHGRDRERHGLGLMMEKRGIYNMSAAGSTSWFGFARIICARRAPQAEVVPISSSEYKTPARRPPYSVLSGSKLKSVFGVVLPRWEESLTQMLEELC